MQHLPQVPGAAPIRAGPAVRRMQTDAEAVLCCNRLSAKRPGDPSSQTCQIPDARRTDLLMASISRYAASPRSRAERWEQAARSALWSLPRRGDCAW